MLGDYWCQAILTDRQPLVNLSKSNILTVREPDYYDSSLPTCSGVKFIYTRRCIPNITVVLPSSSETLSLISITVSIFPTPTLTMRNVIDLKTNTILGHSSTRTHFINLTSKSEQLQLLSSASHQSTTPVSINNDTNYFDNNYFVNYNNTNNSVIIYYYNTGCNNKSQKEEDKIIW